MTRTWLLLTLCLLVPLSGCDLLDPARPIQHPDTEIFGNLIEVTEVEGGEPSWSVTVKVGMPRLFLKAEEAVGKPTPVLEEGISADIVVTRDTVVLAGGAPTSIDEIDPGSEVVVLPVAGTTRMMGTSRITSAAAYLVDFETYRRWRLPGLVEETELVVPRSDPDRINSDGIERAPLPLAGGRVLYFSARLRPPYRIGGEWLGAARPGLDAADQAGPPPERSFRTELGADGWGRPEPVLFEGHEGASRFVLSWINAEETKCLVSVQEESSSWIGIAQRPSTTAPWGSVERITKGDADRVGDAVYLAGSETRFVFAFSPGSVGPSDLWLYDPDAEQTPLPLDPTLNTPGSERCPRVGPDNQLFFVRSDRQFVFAGGNLHELRVPGPHRTVITEAAPSDDSRWVFLCIPNYQPLELDQDIHVAEWLGEGELGNPVPVDEWRP